MRAATPMTKSKEWVRLCKDNGFHPKRSPHLKNAGIVFLLSHLTNSEL